MKSVQNMFGIFEMIMIQQFKKKMKKNERKERRKDRKRFKIRHFHVQVFVDLMSFSSFEYESKYFFLRMLFLLLFNRLFQIQCVIVRCDSKNRKKKYENTCID